MVSFFLFIVKILNETELGRNDGITDGQGESSIAPPPLLQSGAIISKRVYNNIFSTRTTYSLVEINIHCNIYSRSKCIQKFGQMFYFKQNM